MTWHLIMSSPKIGPWICSCSMTPPQQSEVSTLSLHLTFFFDLPKRKPTISLTKFMIKERCDWRDEGCTNGWRVIFVGFLQINHVYEICVVLNRSFLPKDCEIKWVLGKTSCDYLWTKFYFSNLRQLDEPVPNINCRVTKLLIREGVYTSVSQSIRF